MRFLSRRWVQIVLLLLLVAGAFALRIEDPVFIKRLRDYSFDAYNKLLPRPPGEGVAIVDIDEAALQAYGQWPWPRTLLAQLVDNLAAAGARVIAFDMVFSELDRTSPALVAKTLPPTPEMEGTIAALQALPDNETAFAEAIARAGNVVTGFVGADQHTGHVPLKKAAGLNAVPPQHVRVIENYAATLPVLSTAAKGNGSFIAVPEQDGIIRKVDLLVGYRKENGKFDIYPALALEALRVYMGTKVYKPDVSDGKTGRDPGVHGIRISAKDGKSEIYLPTDPQGKFIIHYAGHRESLYIPAARILEGGFPSDLVRGKVVFIGTSSIGLLDLRSSPLDAIVPGVEMHAEIVEQAFQGRFLHRPDIFSAYELAATMAAALLIIVVSPFMGVVPLALSVLAMIGCGVAAALYAYQHYGFLIDPVYPGLVIFTVFIVSAIFNGLRTEMEKKAVRQAFSHYVSPVLMEELAANPEKLKLGGEVREISVMFTDIRNFTTISESMDPAELIRMMNDFLTPMTSCVLDNRGTVDKYMGDAMMAFWNAPLDDPDHARHACTAALRMVESLKPVNESLKANAARQGRAFHELKAGIGINTGRASVGNMGSKQRFAYSALGDTVNLASRLEGQTKGYGITIMLSDAARRAAPDFAAVEIDLLTVKGRTEPERVHALLGGPEEAESGAFKAFAATHAEMLKAYRAQNWDEAERLSAAALQSRPELAGLYRLYAERIAAYRANPPPALWSGVWVAKEK